MRRAPVVRVAHRRVAWLVVGLLLALPASATKIYQWKDANGVTHYTDSPPPGRKHVERSLGARAETAASSKPVVSTSCTDARSNLRLLQGDGPVALDVDRDGKPDSVIADNERAIQLRRAEAAVDVHCKVATSEAPAETRR